MTRKDNYGDAGMNIKNYQEKEDQMESKRFNDCSRAPGAISNSAGSTIVVHEKYTDKGIKKGTISPQQKHHKNRFIK